jgi:hypothetical protein
MVKTKRSPLPYSTYKGAETMKRIRSPETVRGRKEIYPLTCYTPDEVRDMLPQIGDWMWKVPTLKRPKDEKPVPLRCRVIYVNKEHLWYTVEFPSTTGPTFRESYKAPEIER